jgi:HD superfamily phosphohydrolase
MIFRDILYGSINLPEWLTPFLYIPEFVRLRGVRLSNVDSVEFKDFNGPTRWEHSIGAAFLALKFADIKGMQLNEKANLVVAALLHDIGTPPFAHTIEYVLEGFDHEEEAVRLILENESWNHSVFEGSLPQLHKIIQEVGKKYEITVDLESVAQYINGDGKFGFLINGSIDIDNIDNLMRACFYLGHSVEKNIAFELLDWLSDFQTVPTDIKSSNNQSVKKWLEYRNILYGSFFNSSDIELGRQAFLQHLIRRAFNEGLSRKTLIYSTDELLLYSIENYKSDGDSKLQYQNTLKSLVSSYRLLDSTFKFSTILIEDERILQQLLNPLFANWLEVKLSTSTFEPLIIINQRRYEKRDELFKSHCGEICIFKLRDPNIKFEQLPDWIKSDLSKTLKGTSLVKECTRIINNKLEKWIEEKPWHSLDTLRKENIASNLNHEGDWSFKLSKNKSIHTYPATFVNAIPKTLISALGLKGELIVDPFGGTGQTAEEALKAGCQSITSDTNSIAILATKAKLTYLKKDVRDFIKDLHITDIFKTNPSIPPNFPLISKWHHPKTIEELCKIKCFIDDYTEFEGKQFLTACFSEIIISSTDRKGKGSSYFADNTPLPKGKLVPDYQPSIELFINRIYKNIQTIETLYSQLERNRKEPQDELRKLKIKQIDARKIGPREYEIDKKSVAGIITSPPYLCMVDYSLGYRLSYYWLFPEKLNDEFNLEIGSRRKRTNPNKAYNDYLNDINEFITRSKTILRKGGYLCLVLGKPVANAFVDINVLDAIDRILIKEGFELLWEKVRPINWHRNHGITSLDKERISVSILKED